MKITMYGAEICSDCVVLKAALQKRNDIEVDYRNITESTKNMREFLAYRDQETLFDQIKKEGRIGIPFFILEDGTKTLDIEAFIQLEKVEKPVNAGSLDGKGNC